MHRRSIVAHEVIHRSRDQQGHGDDGAQTHDRGQGNRKRRVAPRESGQDIRGHSSGTEGENHHSHGEFRGNLQQQCDPKSYDRQEDELIPQPDSECLRKSRDACEILFSQAEAQRKHDERQDQRKCDTDEHDGDRRSA